MTYLVAILLNRIGRSSVKLSGQVCYLEVVSA